MSEGANVDPFLEIMREVLGERAPGEAREDVLNDNDRFERAFRNMFRGIEQIEMHGGSPLPQGHQIRGFGDLINAMHHAAEMATENGEGLADLTLTEEQMAAMETIAAKGNEGINGNAASCSVCLSDIEQGDKMKKLPCDHMYHVACIDRWLTRSRACPMCKHDCTKPVSSNNRDPQQVRRSDMD